MKKVYFIIPTLSGGGAERVLLHLLKYIDRNKFDSRLILFERKGILLSELPLDIPVEVLKSRKSRYGLQWFVFGRLLFPFFKLVKLLKIETPDAIVSFMWYTNFVALSSKLLSRAKCGIMVSERSSVSLSCEGWLNEFLRRLIIRFFYPIANIIVVNSNNMGIDLTQMFNIPSSKVSVIYNPIDIQRINQMKREEVRHPWYKEDIPLIVAIGRLTSSKGFSYLIKALHIVGAQGIPCRLVILGEGGEEKKLKKLAMGLRVDDRVAFLGFQPNPYKYLARSTLFVLSSLYEGFPNVLLEALALGVPSVATRCPTGPEEIITDGVDGILVPPSDERALADAIKRVLKDEGFRERLGEAGKRRAEDFRVEKIVKQYEDVIEGLCKERIPSPCAESAEN